MAEAIFNYNGINSIIQCKKNDKIKNICDKFCMKIQKDINELVFIYGGELLKLELDFNQVINQIDKDKNKINILVYDTNSTVVEEDKKIKKSKDIICPKYSEPCLIDFKDYKLILNNCKNNHENIISINVFDTTQNIN